MAPLEVGAILRVADLPAIEGVTYLDDRTRRCSRTARCRAASPSWRRRRPPRARKAPRARRASPAPRTPTGARRAARSDPCASSAGKRSVRPWICSSQGWGTPALSTRAIGTTSAGWSSTSSRDGTRGRSRGSSAAGSPTYGSGTRSSALLKPETYMNESGDVDPGGRLVLQAAAGAGPRRPRRRRPRDRAASGAPRRRPRGAQRPALDRPAARFAGLPPSADRRRPARPRRPAPCRRLRPLGVRAGGRRGGDRRAGRRRGRVPRRRGPRGDAAPLQLSSQPDRVQGGVLARVDLRSPCRSSAASRSGSSRLDTHSVPAGRAPRNRRHARRSARPRR